LQATSVAVEAELRAAGGVAAVLKATAVAIID